MPKKDSFNKDTNYLDEYKLEYNQHNTDMGILFFKVCYKVRRLTFIWLDQPFLCQSVQKSVTFTLPKILCIGKKNFAKFYQKHMT